MKTLIINNHTKHIKELENVFPGSVVISKEDIENLNPIDFDLIVISGGSGVPSVVSHNENYILEESIVKSGKPVIGICLGCEIICKAFGGEVEFMSQQEQGEKVFKILDSGMKEKLHESLIKCYEAHWVRMTKVPEEFDVLIQSNHGPEMIKHKTLPILGTQFHPEVEIAKGFWDYVTMYLLKI